VPRTVLVCCSSLIATGPATKGVFSEAAGADLVSLAANDVETSTCAHCWRAACSSPPTAPYFSPAPHLLNSLEDLIFGFCRCRAPHV